MTEHGIATAQAVSASTALSKLRAAWCVFGTELIWTTFGIVLSSGKADEGDSGSEGCEEAGRLLHPRTALARVLLVGVRSVYLLLACYPNLLDFDVLRRFSGQPSEKDLWPRQGATWTQVECVWGS